MPNLGNDLDIARPTKRSVAFTKLPLKQSDIHSPSDTGLAQWHNVQINCYQGD
jgi:hypothetical protein